MGCTQLKFDKRKCPHCKKIVYLRYLIGVWDDVRFPIRIVKNTNKLKPTSKG